MDQTYKNSGKEFFNIGSVEFQASFLDNPKDSRRVVLQIFALSEMILYAILIPLRQKYKITKSTQIAVRFPALRAGRALPQ
jgi:hypothetical protein